MPENWKTYKLEDLTTRVTVGFVGSMAQEYVEDGIPMLRSQNIRPFCLDYTNLKYISPTFHEKIRKSSLKKDDVAIVRTGNPGTACVIPAGIPELNCSDLVIATPDKSKIDPHFLSFYFNSIASNYINSELVGAVQQHFNVGSAKKMEIKLPKIEEQHKIVSILKAIQDKIELNLQMNKTLEEMAMALYKHWFADFGPFQDGEFVDSELGEIPKGWEVKTLEDIIKFSNGYAFKSKQLLKEKEPECFHIFKMGHILKGGGLKADGTKSWIKKSDCKGLDKFILKTGDILMSMTDMKDNMTILGHTALMNENNKYIVNQRVGLLRVANKYGIDYPFVFLLTNSSDFIQRLRSQANSGVQVNLSTSAIKSAQVVVPIKEVNIEFNNITLPYYESINQNALENQTLTQLRDTLLPKLISGEVRVTDVEKTLTEVL